MLWLTDTVNTLGLLLLLGGPVYRLLSAPAWSDPATAETLGRRVFIVMAAGLGLFLVTSLMTISARNPVFTHTLLASVFFVAWLIAEQPNFGVVRILAACSGIGLLAIQVQASHAFGEPGVIAMAGSALHWLAAAAWGGAALHIALQPRPAVVTAEPGRFCDSLRRRWAWFSLVALGALAVSGGLLGYIHIHNVDALNTSTYGTAYKLKLLVAAALLLTLSRHLFVSVAAKHDASPDTAPAHVRRVAAVEALVVVALAAASGVLASTTPPSLGPFLNPQTWVIGDAPGDVRLALQPVAGRSSQVRFEISAAENAPPLPDSARVRLTMVTATGDAGQRDIEALPIGQSTFYAEAVLARPGDWIIELAIDLPDGTSRDIQDNVHLPGPPLQSDMVPTLYLATIGYTPANVLTFVTGLLLLGTAAWSVRLALRRAAPAWLMPLGFVSALGGGFLVLSVMFVKTYPSSFWPNPQPYTANVIREGDMLYREHCAECHGLAGKGDGPWAVATRGSIPDLTAPHMDTHTDGEMYWWNRYGIPSLDMPALGERIGDDENWKIINFVRSLRHGMPPEN